MDRYELGIRIEQLNKTVKKGDFENAAKVAEQLDWRKIKQWTVMSDAIDAFVATEKYDKARNVCIYAYNRHLGGRRLLATLMDMYVKLGEYEDAEEIYHEYVEAAPRDLGRYTLLYKLRKAQGAPVGELIDILQEYKENELDEAYEYELALLYSEAGLTERCVRECDEMVLWFADGVYVEKALRLKQMYTPLTPKQAEKLAYLEKMSSMGINSSELVQPDDESEYDKSEDRSAYSEDKSVYTEDTAEPEEYEQADADAAFREPEESVYSEEDKQQPDTDKTQNVIGETDACNAADTEDAADAQDAAVRPEQAAGVIDALGNTTEWLPIDVEAGLEKSPDNDEVWDINARAETAAEPQTVAEHQTAVEPQSDAKIQHEEEYDITIKVPDYSVYDTRNVQQELKANVAEIMEAYRNREEKEALLEKQSVSMPIMDESAEPTKEIIINTHQWRKASRNLPKTDTKASTADTVILPTKEELLKNAKGSLTVEQMTEIIAMMQEKKAQEENDQIEGQMDITQWLSDLEEEEKENVTTHNIMQNEGQKAADEAAPTEEQPEDDFATIDEEVEEIPDVDSEEEPYKDTYPDIVPTDIDAEDTGISEDADDELPDLEDAVNAGIEKIIDDTVKGAVEESRIRGEAGNYMLQPEERRFLEKYLYMAGMERRLCKYVGGRRINDPDGTSATGNVVIMGNQATDKTAFAVNLFKALHAYDEVREQKLARISAERLNVIGFDSLKDKLLGQTLIIENAGRLNREQISVIYRFMGTDTGGALFILEDDEFSINRLFAENPDFAAGFTGRFMLKQYTVNELVDIAKDYADEQGWRIEDKALLKLYLVLSKLPNDDQGSIVNMVKEIIENAGSSARGRLGYKLFGHFRSVLTIKEADFDGNAHSGDDYKDGDSETDYEVEDE